MRAAAGGPWRGTSRSVREHGGAVLYACCVLAVCLLYSHLCCSCSCSSQGKYIGAIADYTQSMKLQPENQHLAALLRESRKKFREVEGDEPRKAYRATEKGRGELTDRKDETDGLIERIEGQRERRAKSGKAFATPEMFRAIGNLATVLKNRARSGKLDEETMREIVDLVDDLAKKIERL